MPLTLEAKKAVVEEVNAVATVAHSAVAAEYRGLTVAQMSDLRGRARSSGVYLRVVRNTLARLAFEGTPFQCMNEELTGPLVLAFSRKEPGAAARVIKDFARENDKLVVRLVSFDGKLLPPSGIDVLASLPTREEALAQLLSVILAPATQMVRTIAEPHARVARVLGAYREQRETQEQPAADLLPRSETNLGVD